MQFTLDFMDSPSGVSEETIPLVPLRVAGKPSFSEGASYLQKLFFGQAMVRDVPGRRIRLGISLEYSTVNMCDRPSFARGELKAKILAVLASGEAMSVEEIAEFVGIRDGFTRPVRQVINTLYYQKELQKIDGKPVRYILKTKKKS